jgi:formylglycine-generating enzyme required for sulfatase activity
MAPRGGGCLTSREHIWSRYRNFYHLHKRRPFTGIRLAQDAA